VGFARPCCRLMRVLDLPARIARAGFSREPLGLAADRRAFAEVRATTRLSDALTGSETAAARTRWRCSTTACSRFLARGRLIGSALAVDGAGASLLAYWRWLRRFGRARAPVLGSVVEATFKRIAHLRPSFPASISGRTGPKKKSVVLRCSTAPSRRVDPSRPAGRPASQLSRLHQVTECRGLALVNAPVARRDPSRN
jgi:hypothetical protein